MQGKNRFNGNLSMDWHLPSGLKTLSLYDNKIAGSLSTIWVASLPRGLEELDLGATSLRGTLSSALAFPPALRTLELRSNFLSGAFPEDLQLPAGLEELRLVGVTLAQLGDARPTHYEYC